MPLAHPHPFRAEKPRYVLAANAILGRGGQGLNLQHMKEGLEDAFSLELWSAQSVPASPSARVLQRFPIVRRLRDWHNLLADTHFDHTVARRLAKVAVFQGVAGQCAKSLVVARAHGARTVLDVVTTHVDDFLYWQSRECSRFRIRPATHARMAALMRMEYEQADLLRVMSSHSQRSFLERGFPAERVVIVPPPFRLDEFPTADFSSPIFRVLFVGLLEPWKGFHYLIEAFQALKLPDSELELWGGPGSRPVTEYLARAMASCPSIRLQREEVRQVGYGQVYARGSILVQPSLTDGFGYVVAEAMASGLPVIVTRNTGAADWVVEGYNGFIVPPADARAIAERLEYLAAHPQVLRQMGKAARETVRAETMERFRSRFLPHIMDLL